LVASAHGRCGLKRIGAALLGFATPLVLAACGGSSAAPAPGGTTVPAATTIAGPTMPSQPASSGPLALGSAARITDDTGDVDLVSVLSVAVHRTGLAGHAAPRHGEYLVAEVRFDVTSGSDDVNGASFQIVVGGRTYNAVTGPQDASGYAAALVLGTVDAGRPLTAAVVFDAPSAHGTIQYAPTTAPLAEWTA
jgi:hypothetical protein